MQEGVATDEAAPAVIAPRATPSADAGPTVTDLDDTGTGTGAPTGTQPSPEQAPGESSLSHLPGLDGLRAVAVVAVFLFHVRIGPFEGGFLGVSTFFTLSGFLITLLLVREHDRRGRISFGTFWSRRMRRLLPAAFVTVVLAAGLVLAVGTPTQQRSFAGDAASTLLDVANWRFILSGRSYAQLFSAPSPLQHAWSLAVEAQFYLCFAAIATVVLVLTRGSRRVLAAIVVGALVVTQLPVVLGLYDHDRAYYGTDTRIAEMLVGVLLALAVSLRPHPVESGWSPRNLRRIRVAGVVAGVLVLLSFVVGRTDHTWVERGGLVLYAVLSAVLVLAATIPRTAVSAVLSARPLQALGRISYGVYLYHWPIILLLAPALLAWPEPLRALAIAAVTIGLAVLSYRFVELPIRRGHGVGRRPLGLIVAVGATVALVPIVVVAVRAPVDDIGLDQAAGTSINDVQRLGTPPPEGDVTPVPGTGTTAPGPAVPGALAPRPITIPSRPLRVLVLGDSTALALGPQLDQWGSSRGVWTVAKAAISGCGIVRSDLVVNAYFPAPYDHCAKWTTEWPQLIEQTKPDLIVVSTSFWDATDRMFAGDGEWRAPDAPIYEQAIRTDYTLALDELTRTGAAIAWLDHPPVWFNEVSPWPLNFPQIYDAWRMRKLDQIQREVAAGRSGVQIVETERFFTGWPGGVLDPTLRPDGLHIKGEGAAPLIDWLGAEILHEYWAARDVEA